MFFAGWQHLLSLADSLRLFKQFVKTTVVLLYSWENIHFPWLITWYTNALVDQGVEVYVEIIENRYLFLIVREIEPN